MGRMKTTGNLLIRVKDKYKDKIEGTDLYLDVDTTDGHYVNAFGEVVAIPDNLNSEAPLLIPKNQNAYSRLSTNEFYTESEISLDIRIGDLVYFAYYVTFERDPHLIEGEYLYECNYRNVIAVKRGEELIMIGSHVLIEPIKEDRIQSDVLIIPDTAKDKEVIDRGILRHIGNPLVNSNKISTQPGAEVVFDKRFAAKYTIEGNDYWVCYQQDLMLEL